MSSPDGSRPPSENSRPALDDQRSVSDGDLDCDRKKNKRARRRRGTRGRYRPYDLTAHLDEASTSTSATSPSDSTGRKKSRGVVMAPRNTTQFLLDDIEARAEMEREVEHAHMAEGRQRIRSLSVSSEMLPCSDESESSESLSDAEHKEFEAELDEYNIDRISKLSRDEMAREIMDKEKEAEVYHDSLLRVTHENERLKRLLKDNGINPTDNHALESQAKPGILPQAVS